MKIKIADINQRKNSLQVPSAEIVNDFPTYVLVADWTQCHQEYLKTLVGWLISYRRGDKARSSVWLSSFPGVNWCHHLSRTSLWNCDEAHFWLNGYVNKQNCRIWREANPQVYVETPLHPEKLTVWCALWAGGILLQKR
ncbi:hypothetical protein TNCV_2629111 [Trichonephila clavipes]|uniref:Uncharacterized protein n=1 Tax=Trichonephila clavipes TaxID=2585209 RepID=A0A8X6SA48_TRICX|nr:hypothetical protein TNCV_2629111 [Trichonephila clavipes]